ncbi:hypothetical protein PROFUN_00155 [Planoprotostelium fungivorum]|uniref:Uncharacterized protein n=1 Tax=Planoprotostelium fungivorum TaxID=1890364 RepID=A0A2P6P0T5_9EUKA|nr:hypothetical protein PROFUN_00155 [Planoprotostelium fungivorum]
MGKIEPAEFNVYALPVGPPVVDLSRLELLLSCRWNERDTCEIAQRERDHLRLTGSVPIVLVWFATIAVLAVSHLIDRPDLFQMSHSTGSDVRLLLRT